MAFKKIIRLNVPMIIGVSDNSKELFPPGFSYKLGNIVYTVKGDVTKETNSPMREVSLSDGTTEIIPVEAIKKDIKTFGCVILTQGKNIPSKEIKKNENKVAEKQKSSIKKETKKTKKTKRKP